MAVDKGTKVLLDAIAFAEGHGNRLTYNASYAHGKYTGNVTTLTSLTLDEIRALQEEMLARQSGKLQSSAIGRYQFIRATFDDVRSQLGLPGTTKFSPGVQDDMAYFLLVRRGYEKFRAGTLSKNEFQDNLAQEWASIPRATTVTSGGKTRRAGHSHYGQGSGITTAQLDWALERVGDRTPYGGHVEDKVPDVITDNKFNWVALLGAIAYLIIEFIEKGN